MTPSHLLQQIVLHKIFKTGQGSSPNIFLIQSKNACAKGNVSVMETVEDVFTVLCFITDETNIIKPVEIGTSLIKPDMDHYPKACFVVHHQLSIYV